jgi:hypothetical protein
VTLYWISLPHATFGMVADNVVRRTAPIAKWAIGKPTDYVLAYFRRKGGEVRMVQE